VGVVIDFWEQQVAKGTAVRIPVRVVNDLDTAWQGEVVLRLLREGQLVWEQPQALRAEAYQVAVAEFDVPFPAQDAALQLVAELRGADHRPVRSLRDVRCQEIPVNLALGRPVAASSQVRNAQGFFPAALAVDGRSDTRWSSEFADHQWLEVDLGPARPISRVTLTWERAHGLAYAIEVSTDGSQWKEVWRTETGRGGEDEIRFAPVTARYLRFRGDRRATEHGFSLWELQVFGPPASPESAAGRDRKPE
jgi:hypothetical protein